MASMHRMKRRFMKRDRLFVTGLIGSVVTALCCFTPVLAVLLAAGGLSAWVGWLDIVLLPVLAIFLALTLYALIRVRRVKTQT